MAMAPQTLEPTTVLCYDGKEYWRAVFSFWNADKKAQDYADYLASNLGERHHVLVIRGNCSIWKMPSSWWAEKNGYGKGEFATWEEACKWLMNQ